MDAHTNHLLSTHKAQGHWNLHSFYWFIYMHAHRRTDYASNKTAFLTHIPILVVLRLCLVLVLFGFVWTKTGPVWKSTWGSMISTCVPPRSGFNPYDPSTVSVILLWLSCAFCLCPQITHHHPPPFPPAIIVMHGSYLTILSKQNNKTNINNGTNFWRHFDTYTKTKSKESSQTRLCCFCFQFFLAFST